MGATSQLTNLIPNLTGIDPDDAFSSVPYEKGQTLLWYLEELVGGKTLFEPFFKSYVAHFQYRSIVSQDFVDYLMEYFKNSPDVIDRLDKVDWEAWFHTPGMPCIIPKYDTSLATCCTDLCKEWCDWNSAGCPEPCPFSGSDLKTFSSGQIQQFLSELLIAEPLNPKTIDVMRPLYSFDSVRNSEIKMRWLRLGLKAQIKEAIAPAIEFATSHGRLTLVRPIFRFLSLIRFVIGVCSNHAVALIAGLFNMESFFFCGQWSLQLDGVASWSHRSVRDGEAQLDVVDGSGSWQGSWRYSLTGHQYSDQKRAAADFGCSGAQFSACNLPSCDVSKDVIQSSTLEGNENWSSLLSEIHSKWSASDKLFKLIKRLYPYLTKKWNIYKYWSILIQKGYRYLFQHIFVIGWKNDLNSHGFSK